MVITMTMISTIMRPMAMMKTTEEPVSYLMMTRKVVTKMMTDMTIIFLATTAAHPKMTPMLPLLSTLILRTVLLTSMAHPTTAAQMDLTITPPPRRY